MVVNSWRASKGSQLLNSEDSGVISAPAFKEISINLPLFSRRRTQIYNFSMGVK
jgi:hypothetical protein